jgi:hypothetical protein
MVRTPWCGTRRLAATLRVPGEVNGGAGPRQRLLDGQLESALDAAEFGGQVLVDGATGLEGGLADGVAGEDGRESPGSGGAGGHRIRAGDMQDDARRTDLHDAVVAKDRLL